MADGVVLDLYAEDLDKDFALQGRDEFGGDGVDLYDDIGPADASVGGPTGEGPGESGGPAGSGVPESPGNGSNGVYHQGAGGMGSNNVGRRYQLYVGNLTWWTTDQDITNVMREIGVNDFQEVKFFENRANGQSKGFCVVSMGSESSSRIVLERLPKKELHGQLPMVTFPTKQALNQFESMQKTRPVPPPQQNGPPRGPAPANMVGGGGQMPGHPPAQGMPPGHPQRMMNPNMPPGPYRPQHMGQGPPVGAGVGVPPRLQASMHQGGPMGAQQPLQGPPRYPLNQNQWGAGQPRPNGPRPGGPPGPSQRPPMFQGPPGAMPLRGPRPDWNRPPMHGGGFPPQGGPPGGPPQGPPMMQGPPRGPPGAPPQIGGPGGPPGTSPNPHVNPGFFNQGGVPPQHPGVPPMGGPHGPPGPPQQGMNMPPQHGPPPHFGQGGPRGPWPGPPQVKPPGPFPDAAMGPQLTEAEFEEVMSRNRTVSSSAISRAVSDAATGEYTSAIETLVTAISLIKQSKVAHDERCKILISSLQDTLHGIEAKSYNRRERSRSRERTHRTRPRRERSTSRYRERDRDHREREGGYRERSRSREREREGGYRERTRSRERERPAPDHYRDDSSSRSGRPRKSPEQAAETVSEAPSKRSYYEERSTSRYRERDRDRDRREEHRSRH